MSMMDVRRRLIIAALAKMSAGGRYSEGLAYTLSGDGTYYSVSGIGTCTDTDVVIPPVYEGLPVTAIGERAFRDRAYLTSVELPDSVTTIGVMAFYGCAGLTGVKFGIGVVTIDGWAFQHCTSLTDITIPGSVVAIGLCAFYNCTGLTSATIGGGVVTIEQYAFWGCGGVAHYDFTKSTSVPALRGVNAFDGIAADCEIRVPAALYYEWKAAKNWATYAEHIVAV